MRGFDNHRGAGFEKDVAAGWPEGPSEIEGMSGNNCFRIIFSISIIYQIKSHVFIIHIVDIRISFLRNILNIMNNSLYFLLSFRKLINK